MNSHVIQIRIGKLEVNRFITLKEIYLFLPSFEELMDESKKYMKRKKEKCP